jgi:hypothetical protein
VSARGRTAAVGALATALALSLGATAALAAGSSGDPQSIALYRAAVHATNALPAYVQHQTGYVQFEDSLGPKRVAHWAWGWDQAQRGYHPATERLVIVQHDGKVSWIEDTLSASTKGCHSPSCRLALPIVFLITPTKAFYGIISSGSTASCFVPETTEHVPYSAGLAWWTVSGHYAPSQRAGAMTEVTSRFMTGGQKVTESDWITSSTHVFDRSVLHVAAGHRHPGFSFRNVDATLASAPHFPRITLCSKRS